MQCNRFTCEDAALTDLRNVYSDFLKGGLLTPQFQVP